MRRRWPHLAFAIYALACLAALVWPGYAWLGNRIEPYVFGLPFSLAWIVGWVVLTCFVLAVFHAVTGTSEDSMSDDRVSGDRTSDDGSPDG